jgi:hypothetical protein
MVGVDGTTIYYWDVVSYYDVESSSVGGGGGFVNHSIIVRVPDSPESGVPIFDERRR